MEPKQEFESAWVAKLSRQNQLFDAFLGWASLGKWTAWEILNFSPLAAGLGNSRQVGGNGQSWNTGYGQLG